MNADTSLDRNRKRWPQFGLKALMVMFVVSAVAVAWCASNCREFQRQIALVESLGLTQGYVYEGDHYAFGKDDGGMLPTPPNSDHSWYEIWNWNWDWEQLLYLKRVKWVGFSAADQNDLATISELPSLEMLVLAPANDLKDLTAIANPLPNCKNLTIGGYASSSIESLHGMAKFPELENLNLYSQDKLTDLKPLVNCKKLLSLKHDCSFSAASSLDAIGGLGNLEELELHSDDIENLDFLNGLNNLKTVNFPDCSDLRDIGALSLANALNKANFRSCRSIETMEALANCQHLEYLCIDDCKRIRALPNFPKSKTHVDLQFANCASLTNLDGLPNSERTKLQVLGCRSLTKLDLRKFPVIKALTISGAPNLTEIIGIPEPNTASKLKVITITGCPKLKDVDCIGNPEIVEMLEISTELPIEMLPEMKSLRSLRLYGNQTLTDIQQLPDASSLDVLSLRDCRNLKGLSGVSKFPKLGILRISNSPKLVDLAPIAELTRLRTLSVTGCRNLANIEGLVEELPLSSVDLSDSVALEDASPLSRLSKLGNLGLAGCSSIKSLAFLKKLTLLGSLDITGCNELQSLEGLEDQPVTLLDLDLANVESVGRLRLPKVYRLNFSQYPSSVLNLGDEDPLNLREISVKNSPELKTIQVNATGDLSIELNQCPNFEAIQGPTGELHLTIKNLDSDFDFEAVLEGHEVGSLILDNVNAAIDLSFVGELLDRPEVHEMQTLYLGGIESAETLRKLQLSYDLENLTLIDSPALEDLEFLLERLEKNELSYLSIKGCPNLHDITQLKQLKISMLEISDCPLISESQIAEVWEK